jgi:hypothetical protein
MQNKISRQNQKLDVVKHKIKDLSVGELIKANSLLSQNCIKLSNHLNRCENDINSLYHQNLYLKHEIGDLKGVLEVFAMRMGMEKEMFEHRDDEQPRKRIVKEPKALPLHDDLTMRCPSCGNLNNRDFKTCGECGYKK